MINRKEERPLTPDDVACVSHLAREVPAAFATLDPDMIVAYVCGSVSIPRSLG